MIMILSPSVGVAGRSVQPASRSHDPANARRDDGYEWALGAGQTLARGAQRRGLAHLPRRRKFFHKASGVAAAGGTFGLRAITEFSQVSRPPQAHGSSGDQRLASYRLAAALCAPAASYGRPNSAINFFSAGFSTAICPIRWRTAGAATIAQDENTSAVWGMSGQAVQLGALERVLPLSLIAAQSLIFAAR